MPESPAPADVVRAVAAGVSRLVAGKLTEPQRKAQIEYLTSLYAERTDVRHPFAAAGEASLRTRTELRQHFAAAPGHLPGVERFEPVGQVHQTTDPEVVIYEFSYEGTTNGRPFTIPAIFVTRVRDGLIVESRDYADHVGLARAFGRLDDLITALTAR